MSTSRTHSIVVCFAVCTVLAAAGLLLQAGQQSEDTEPRQNDADAVERPGGAQQPIDIEPLSRRRETRRGDGRGLAPRNHPPAGSAPSDWSKSSPKRPKVDAFDRFDDAQSPLQRGMLDARDKAWRKRAKLGSNPECSRIVREFARERQPKLCFDSDAAPLSRQECLAEYCCDGAASCSELDCANALIDGDDLAPCFDKSSAPDECVSEIFGKKAGQPRIVDCLENPFDDEGEIRNKCKNVFDKCPDAPMVRADRDEARSGTIRDDHNRKMGRRIQTRTVIHYDSTKQRGKGSAKDLDEQLWDPIRIRDSRSDKQRRAVPGATQPVESTLSAGTFNADCDPLYRCAENDDGDCVDRVTDIHYTEDQCFDQDRLRGTLELLPERCPLEGTTVICCRHVGVTAGEGTGELFYEDDCLIDPAEPATPDNLRTTLVQMIDEDPFDSLNNDGDCSNGLAVTSDCLTDSGDLRAGFQWNVDEEDCDGVNDDNDCMGSGGRIGNLVGDVCVHESLLEGPVTVGHTKGEDFIELIDEDCAESTADADRLDNDGDGVFGEDPPGVKVDKLWLAGTLAAEEAACRAFFTKVGEETGVTDLEPTAGELPDEEQGCDMSRAMRVRVNWELRNSPRHEEFKQKTKKDKIFDVDAHGRWCGESGVTCDADASNRGVAHPGNDHDPRNNRGGGKSYKHEDRRVTLDEVFAVKCKRVRDKQSNEWIETYYDEETGTCVRVDGGDSAARWLKMLRRGEEACQSDECVQAMMGFTFAPPVLEWGWRAKEEICIFGFCFEIFYARIGYEFDLATGVRLPVEVEFDGIPDSVLATHEVPEIDTSLQPLDFDYDDYQAFCEAHDLDDPWYIANCQRFSFPDFLDNRDGDEFVAHYSVFAGIIVRLLMIPIINFGIDSSIDVPAMCTMWKMKDGIEGISLTDLIKIELGLLEDGDVLQTLKDNFGNCGSFTTPFGFEQCNPIDPGCPLNGQRLRAWPFLNLSKKIRADCFDAMRAGEFVTIKGQKRPICTGLILGTSGASLGVGIGVELTAGSLLIDTDWSAYGDATAPGGELEYTRSADDPDNEPQTIPPVLADNYTDKIGDEYQDNAIIGLDRWTYYLNAIEITLSASLEFGGILSPIPDIGTFPIYSFAFDTTQFGWDGIPIPQHPGTRPVEIAVPVENYGLAVDLRPEDALEVKPGCGVDEPCPDYEVWVTNIGSRSDGFDNFGFELSNRQVVSGCDTEFRIDPNNDHDCHDASGVWHREDPFDGRADDCFDACGHLLAGAVEAIGEDPPGCMDAGSPCRTMEERDDDGDGLADEDGPEDAWQAGWYEADQLVTDPEVIGVGAHTEATEPVMIRVSPLRHPFTGPGVYPFRVRADSVAAKANQLPAQDPLGYYRIGSPDEAVLEVITFFDPQIQVVPGSAAITPGLAQTYAVEVRNGSNVDDNIDVTTEFLDSNQAGCDLVTLGLHPDCPFRSVPTVVPDGWLVGTPPDRFGPLMPSQFDAGEFGIDVPSDWAGMVDTPYEFEVTAHSEAGAPVKGTFLAEQIVRATLESMTRYVGLEIQALIASIEQANAEGVRTAGLHPIATHPVQQAQQRALDRILSGNASGGAKALETCIRTTEAFLRALAGSGGNGKIPEPWFSEFQRRAEAIVADLNAAVAHGSQ